MLGLKFGLDDTCYTVEKVDNYFHTVTPNFAAEELIRLQENATDPATVDS